MDLLVLTSILKVVIVALIAFMPFTAPTVSAAVRVRHWLFRAVALATIVAGALWDPTLGVLLVVLYAMILMQTNVDSIDRLYETYAKAYKLEQTKLA